MCHNSGVQCAQIDRFVENGMPQKIVKTVKYTMKKRVQAHEKEQLAATQTSSSRLVAVECNNPTKDETTVSSAIANSPAPAPVPNAVAAITTSTTAPVMEIPNETKRTQSTGFQSQLKIPKLCGRFRQQQNQSRTSQSEQKNSTNSDANSDADAKVYVDALAVGTQLTRQFAQRLNGAVEKLQHSRIYTLLTKTTQPAHVIAIGILSFVLLTIWPELIESSSSNVAGAEMTTTAAAIDSKTDGVPVAAAALGATRKTNTLVVIAYLGAFATHFGAQIWMTFVSGLALYFSLPRHTFGQCQQILFPKYFALNAGLSIGMLILYVKYFLTSWSSVAGCVQLAALALSAAIEVTVRLYLAPPMLQLMHEKYKIEGAIGSGQEVGSLVQKDLVECPHYQRIHKSFRRIHMTIAMGNMAVLLATCVHLCFLATKIQIS